MSQGGGISAKMIGSRGQMDPNDFQVALGDFPVDMFGTPVSVLIDQWNEEMTQAFDMIVPRLPLSGLTATQVVPWLLRGLGI